MSADWPPGRPRILVADAWLANAGDGAIALASDARVKRLAPEASVLHAAYQADLVAGSYPGLRFVPPLDGLLGVVSAEPELTGWEPERARALVESADAVLSQGGGFLLEHYGPWQRLRAWELVVEAGIPIAFCAQTVGPWRAARERAMLGRAFRAAAAVGVRERASAGNVVELGADPERVVVGGDEAFALWDAAPAARGEPPRGLAAVLSAHPVADFDGAVREPVGGDRPRGLAALVERLVAAVDGEGVTLLSTQQGLGGLDRGLEDDAALASEVVAHLPPAAREQVSVHDGYLGPLEFATAIAGARALVTMRMHPAILALSRGVPVVALEPGFKTLAVLEEAGLAEVVATSLDVDEVARRAAAAASPDAPRGEALWERLTEARRRAAINDVVIERLLAAARSPCG